MKIYLKTRRLPRKSTLNLRLHVFIDFNFVITSYDLTDHAYKSLDLINYEYLPSNFATKTSTTTSMRDSATPIG